MSLIGLGEAGHANADVECDTRITPRLFGYAGLMSLLTLNGLRG